MNLSDERTSELGARAAWVVALEPRVRDEGVPREGAVRRERLDKNTIKELSMELIQIPTKRLKICSSS